MLRTKSMTCVAHAVQIDLRFRNAPREFLDFSVGIRSGNFAR